MEWQQLIGFCQVARLGSFTQAAVQTFRTQSALSQQVKALEAELGCRLLERLGKRRLRLTAAGEKMWRFAEEMLGQYDGLKEELAELRGVPQGPLGLAAPFTTLYHLLSRPLTSYLKRYPLVRLTLLDRPLRQVVDLVRQGTVDFGLGLKSQAPPEVEAVPWKRVETYLMVPEGHVLAGQGAVSLAEIAQFPLILPPQEEKSAYRGWLEERLREQGLAYHVILESANVELSALYVEQGLGIACATVAAEQLLHPPRRLAFLPLRHYVPPDTLVILRRPGRFPAAYKEAFLEELMKS
jgi:DNA-binding transcriptional LysR family regulator